MRMRPVRSLRFRHGFTMVEMLTVIALIAVLATLVTSSVAGAKLRSQQTVCMSNLRQLALAVEIYSDDTGKRPRSVTRLTQRPSWLGSRGVLLCPSDVAINSPAVPSPDRTNHVAWGNVANASQEPWLEANEAVRSPETGSWQAELAESEESVAFSYLHPLGWRKQAWQRLSSLGSQAGTGVCQLHGVKVPRASLPAEAKPYLNFEGRTFRAQRDGAVVQRKIFRTPTTGQSASTTTANPTGRLADYPWEFYADSVPPAR